MRVAALEERRPLLPAGFLYWILGRLLAMAVLVGAAWFVYDCASSDRFQVRSVRVVGNALLSRAEVEGVVAVKGANVFWVDRDEAAARVRALAVVEQVVVTPVLPDAVEVRLVERRPAAFWVSGDQTYLVDGEGIVLKPADAETQQVRACAGQPCDPRLAPLPTVAQVDGQPLTPGDRVDAHALSTSEHLASVLPSVGIEPLAFEWSRDLGLEVPTRDGWRARFDSAGDVDQQVASLRTVRDVLVRSKSAAELIDVRFGDRPYFR